MSNSDDQIIQALVELNMRIEAYFEQIAENKLEAAGTEESLIKLMRYVKNEGYKIKSSFFQYCYAKVQELNRIHYEKNSVKIKTSTFRSMRNRFREILLKRDLQTYLETCETGANFTLEVGEGKVIHFKPSLSIITNIKIMIYEDFGI